MKVAAVIIKGSIPTDEEKEIAEALGARNLKYCNGRFAEAKRSEVILCTALVNLSGKEELDEFYADKLVNLDEFYKSKTAQFEALSVMEVVEQPTEEAPAIQEKPELILKVEEAPAKEVKKAKKVPVKTPKKSSK